MSDDAPLLAGDEHGVEGVSSLWQAGFNMVNVLAGVGSLSLPFAFRLTGWATGSALLAYLCLTTNYTAKLIGRCMGADKNVRSYTDLGALAFGAHGRSAISVVFCIELLAALAMYVTLMGDNLARVLGQALGQDAPSRQWLYVACTAVVLPTCWTSQLSLLSHLSVVGTLSTFALLMALVYTGLTSERGQPEGGSFYSLDWAGFIAGGPLGQLPYAVGLEMCGFAGHAVVPSIYDSLEDKDRFPALVDAVFVVCSALYLTMALVGYLLFTSHTEEEVTLNLYDVAGGSLVVKITTWLTILNPATKFALTLNPLAQIVARVVMPSPEPGPQRSSDGGGGGGSSGTRATRTPCGIGRRTLQTKVLRTTLVLVAMSAAIFVPSFSQICAFVGAFCAFIVSAVFPILCYLKISWSSVGPWERRAALAMLTLNSLLCVVGTAAVFVPPDAVHVQLGAL